jgi:hypothetical protein
VTVSQIVEDGDCPHVRDSWYDTRGRFVVSVLIDARCPVCKKRSVHLYDNGRLRFYLCCRPECRWMPWPILGALRLRWVNRTWRLRAVDGLEV